MAKSKIPTADEDKNLGTGQTDFIVGLDGYKVFNNFVPYAGVGYYFFGKADELGLTNAITANVGASFGVTTMNKFKKKW